MNFTPKNYTSKLVFEKKKFSIPESFGLKIAKMTILGCRTKIFFFVVKKLIIVFFRVKYTGDYRDVAIISTLFRDHSQKSKKPNFSSFFLTFDSDPEVIM